jgi:hypothetical protein
MVDCGRGARVAPQAEDAIAESSRLTLRGVPVESSDEEEEDADADAATG